MKERRQKLVNKDTKVLVGVSGGPDSMYLLRIMKELFKNKGYPKENLHIISCDHQTRSGINDEMQTVRDNSLHHPWKCIQYCGKKTTEDALRQWRHTEFIHYAHKEDIGLIFLGHHLDDRIETSIMHIQQGCGREGFAGMMMTEKHFLDPEILIVRPLISYSKDEILRLCEVNNIPYHIDPTNADIGTSQRNKLRQHIQTLSKNNKFKKSFARIYDHYDGLKMRDISELKQKEFIGCYPYCESHEVGTWILQINPHLWNEELLYLIYRRHHKTIRPRASTLSRLAEQLHNGNASISYQGISIESKKYVSIIKIKT